MPDEEEQQNTPDISEFEAKSTASSSNKDLWLFLIIVDVILLCVFGFFLYKNLSAKLLFSGTEPTPAIEVEDTVVVEEDSAFSNTDVPSEPQAPLAVEEVKAPANNQSEQASVAPQSQETPIVEKTVPVEKPVSVVPAEKKQSVIVQATPNSKYRQVTFRYFGKAKEVAVVSGFTMTKPRAMTQKDGVWETTLSISPGTYKYLLVVDGQQQPDPYAPQKDGRSILVVE